MSRWRRRAPVVLLALVSGGLLLAVTTQPWVRATLPAGPGGTGAELAVAGSTATAAASALGLVAVAGAVALSTLRGAGRVAAAVLLVVAGLGAAASAVLLVADPTAAARTAARAATGVAQVDAARATAWALVAVLPSAGVLVAGVLALVCGRSWRSSERFEAPGGARAARTAPRTPAALWDELSRGGDPTAAERPERAE